jgi:hypothetical protein
MRLLYFRPSALVCLALVLLTAGAFDARSATAATWSADRRVASNQVQGIAATAFTIFPESTTGSRLDLFAIGTDRGLYWNQTAPSDFTPSDQWMGWSPAASGSLNGLAATSPAFGVQDVFTIGADSVLYYNEYNGSGWNGWSPLEYPKKVKAVAATSLSQSRLDVLVIGTDDRVYHKTRVYGVWSPYYPIASNQVKGIAATAVSSNRLQVVVIGTDDVVYVNELSATWSGYSQIASNKVKAIAAASLGGGKSDVFVIGTDDRLYYNRRENGVWSGYQPLGSAPIKALAAAPSPFSGRLDVFTVRIEDSAVWQKTYS